MTIDKKDIDHIFERLRSGVVPERGLETFAVGIDKQRKEIERQLSLTESGEGVFKFLRGGYGCGKTFMARLAILEAINQGFATSFVVVSDNDLHFHKFDDVYRKVVQELGTQSCPRGALGDILDRWIGKIEDSLISGGADEDATDFDEQVSVRLNEELVSLTKGKAPEDMGRVLRTIFKLKQERNFSQASSLISWLSGSENVATKDKAIASIKGDIGSKEALDYLQGILEIVKAAGYKGLVIVIDEVETILRMRRDIRGKSLNGIRQICDASADYHGLLWVFTGTPEFFDTKKGVAGLQPLHDRIKFLFQGNFVNSRQPQLELKPFDKPRLKEVALKLRELYPTSNKTSLIKRITSEYIEQLIDRVTEGFGGDVGIVPRQFLRQFVDILDLAEDNDDFDPSNDNSLLIESNELNQEEKILLGKEQFESDEENQEFYEPIEF